MFYIDIFILIITEKYENGSQGQRSNSNVTEI